MVFDWVSRSEVFASLYPALIQGYALDALKAEDASAPTIEDANGFISVATAATTSERDGIGLGREVRFSESELIGTGLAAGNELVQLTVHLDQADANRGPHRARRIRRTRPASRFSESHL